MRGIIFVTVLLLNFNGWAEDVLKVSLSPVSGMTRADLWYLKPNKTPQAVLILCPGYNGNGEGFVNAPAWRAYAQEMNLGLVGLSFASQEDDLQNGNGYYYARRGSGMLLLEGLKRIYHKDLPILIYGFSGGAHFTARLVEWKPERIISWCAYSAAWWDNPKKSTVMPPGIVACGKEDERLGPSQSYFWDGREVGKPWLWIDVYATDHAMSSALDSFVREYFKAVLKSNKDTKSRGRWVSIYDRTPITSEYEQQKPCEAAWLPDITLLPQWIALTEGKAK